MENFIKKYWWLLVVIAISTKYIYIQTRSPADYCDEEQRYLTNEELINHKLPQGLIKHMADVVKDKTKKATKLTNFEGIDANTTEFYQVYPQMIWVNRDAKNYDIPIVVFALYYFTPKEKEIFNKKYQEHLQKYFKKKSIPLSKRWGEKTIVGISYEQWLNGCGSWAFGQISIIDLIEEDTDGNKRRYKWEENPYQNNYKQGAIK